MTFFQEITTFANLPVFHARIRPEETAFVFGPRLTSYGEFERNTTRIANGLAAWGIPPQTRIAYLGRNSDWYFELLFGAARANIVTVPINWRLAPPEIAFIIEDCQAEALFVGPEFLDLVKDLKVKHIVPMSEDGFAAWRNKQSGDPPDRPIGADDVVVQLYTSGTTGKPKGAQLTNRNFFGAREILNKDPMEWNVWDPSDVSLVAMPVFHIGGTGWGVMGLYAGARNVVHAEFSPPGVLEAIQRHRISKLFMVPAAIKMVLENPACPGTDFSCLRYMLYGASPIPLDLLRRALEVFKCGFVQMYGMTETTGTIVYLPPEDHDPAGNRRMRSAGKPYPGVEVAILDLQGRKLPTGQVGEICIRATQNMKGYWNLPEATARTIAPDGWLHTGDAGYLDEDGYVYVHDRVKDMIVSGGENIYPAEVESAIYGHPAVADVAVIGVPDDKWGEAVKAIIVLKPGMTADADDIIAFARQRIAGYKVPKSIDFATDLPRNPSGKLLKKELRAPFWIGRERMVN